MHENDDPSCPLYPYNFDFGPAEERARRLADQIKVQFGVNVHLGIGANCQDSFYHANLSINELTTDKTWICISLSNYGEFATIIHRNTLPGERFEKLVKLLEAASYVFIPYEVLLEVYDGPEGGGFKSWFDRYFEFA